MAVIRIRDRNALSPSHVVMIVVVCAIVAGGSLLLSAPESQTLVDGAKPWREGSVLKSVVAFLCLNYSQPTLHADEVKNLALGLGAGIAAIVLGISLLVRPVSEAPPSEEEVLEAVDDEEESSDPAPHKAHVAPLAAAQAFAALYLLWSFASARWSVAPELAIGGSILLAVQFVWALAIGNGLSPRAAQLASRSIIIVTAVASAMAIWYWFGRNPEIRAKFPYGNPLFLAACLIPGIALSLGLLAEKLGPGIQAAARSAGWVITALVALALCGWAFVLTGSPGPLSLETVSRAALLGIAAGGVSALFFAMRSRARWVPVAVGVAIAGVGWATYRPSGDDSFGRQSSLALRGYAWDYALKMFGEHRFLGHGQGGFALKGDSYAEQDVLEAPTVFRSRIAHAHSEWLEVLADLGSIGFVLIAAVLVLTIRAGMLALASRPPPGQRWALIALLAALVGLIVEESFSVGLRVAGVPTMFFTVLGLIWALSGTGTASPISRLPATGLSRRLVGVFAVVVGLASGIAAQADFSAARNLYHVTQNLTEDRLEDAVAQAEVRTAQLSPQRALENLAMAAEARIRSAMILQSRAGERLGRASADEMAGGQLILLAREDVQRAADHAAVASTMLTRLVGWSPGYLNHGWMEYRLRLTQAGLLEMAAALGANVSPDELQRMLQQAAAALERELRRQPINPILALEYSRFMGQRLPLEGHIELLARPMRYERFTPAAHEHLLALARAPDFDEKFEPIVTQATLAVSASTDATEQARTWAPEVLRLAAAVNFTEGRFDQAVARLEAAARRYESLPATAAIGAASCYADLALCRFFMDPARPEPSIEAARRAVAHTPESELGRALRRGIESKSADYLLAAGREADAAAMLRQTAPPNTPEEAVQRQLGIRYSRMCYDLLQRRSPDGTRIPPAELPAAFDGWLSRAKELAGDDYVAYLVSADVAFSRDDYNTAAEELRGALERGLPVQDAWRYLGLALVQKPDAAALTALRDEIQARVEAMPPEQRPSLPELKPPATDPKDDTADPAPPPSLPPVEPDADPAHPADASKSDEPTADDEAS